jgi:signal transduction histidine kinase
MINSLGFGLRTTIVVNISLVMFIAMLLTGFVVITTAQKTIYDNKVQSAQTIVKSLQHIIVPSFTLPSDSSSSPDKVLEEFSGTQGLESIVVVDPSLNVLTLLNQKKYDIQISKDFLQEVLRVGRMLTEIKSIEGGKYMAVGAPLFKDQMSLGAVGILLPLSGIESSIAQFQKTVMVFAISTALVFIVLGSFLLTRYLVKPLEKLIKATEDISEGYVPKHLEASSSNEIGTLSVSLSRMSDKLREDKEKINIYIQSLEKSNRKLKRAQDEVIRSEKLASVGRLAAGVAHEIGNPIGIILGYIEILRQDYSNTKKDNESLERLEKEVMRIDTIIRELLSFSRPNTINLQPLQANEVIKEATSIIGHQKGFRGINLELNLQSTLPPIMGDEGLLQQVLINLFINAMDAMPDGGILSVSSEYRTEKNHGPLDYTLPQDGITIQVSDSGSGINKNHINKIFDPFFTTKSPGKGTGLGLSVCHRIIESLGGIITVQSIFGKGTTFTIILPTTQKKKDTIKKTA